MKRKFLFSIHKTEIMFTFAYLLWTHSFTNMTSTETILLDLVTPPPSPRYYPEEVEGGITYINLLTPPSSPYEDPLRSPGYDLCGPYQGFTVEMMDDWLTFFNEQWLNPHVKYVCLMCLLSSSREQRHGAFRLCKGERRCISWLPRHLLIWRVLNRCYPLYTVRISLVAGKQ